MRRLLIAGCGDIGIRLAGILNRNEWQTFGLRRKVQALPDSIDPVSADLLDAESLSKVAGRWDGIIYQATPDRRDPDAYRRAYVDGFENLLSVVEASRLIFVSSTAVYGQDDGSLVDENSATEPLAFNGRILLEAERGAIEAGGLAVRFSGIYGPGREYLINQVRGGKASCREQPPQWTNRIHADDCAAVLAHLLELEAPDSIYCASDDEPAPRCLVLDWLAEHLGVVGPARQDSDFSGQGKRISNQRLRASGYDFRYPDFRSGYGDLLT
jgi:nucleoside-diphosphate-sugar epimerase